MQSQQAPLKAVCAVGTTEHRLHGTPSTLVQRMFRQYVIGFGNVLRIGDPHHIVKMYLTDPKNINTPILFKRDEAIHGVTQLIVNDKSFIIRVCQPCFEDFCIA